MSPMQAPMNAPMQATTQAPTDGPTRYRVEHETHYAYDAPVSQSWQLARLTPRELAWQRLQSCALQIEPPPDERHEARDSYGNWVTHFALHGAHRSLCVRMQCQVEVAARSPLLASGVSWEHVREAIAVGADVIEAPPAKTAEPAQASAEALHALHMTQLTRLVPWSTAAHAYAAKSLRPGREWLEGVTELMHRIHHEFVFDPEATTVSTSVDEVLHKRRGVCQDFAHLMLACLRSHGLAARYVSGYLLTDPPEGQPRLLGVDASHAWVAVYAPAQGWVELDPTNDQPADARYITLAWGADFADVVPLRGVILGGGEQAMRVSVSVIPI
jgi:transglutaminase-like putative cysteine protease